MQLQATTDYAIRILQYLHKAPDDIYQGPEIAEAVGITYPMFNRVARKLKETGLLQSAKGKYGGFMLGKLATEISFYEVLLSTQGEFYMNQCLEKGMQCERETCKTYEFLQAIQQDMIENMSSMCVADLA